MKNRLEIAKDLLRDDGVVFVQCDDNEQAYLKVLMDEIFGRDNFVSCFVWRKKYGGGKGAKLFVDTHEYILIYARNIQCLSFNLLKRTGKQLEIFQLKDEFVNERGKYYVRPLKSGLEERKTLIYPIECPDGSFIETQWICSEETFHKLKNEGRIVFKLLKNKTYNIYKKFYENDMEGILQESIIYDLAYNADAKLEIKKIFNIEIGRNIPFTTPKPEALLQRIINLATNENDIVLDFHLGSGTTAAVAHKMGRQYIGIEQMDYIEDIAVERLKKVIAGEQGGISKSVDWKGGGEFIYLELKKYNQNFIDAIEKAKSSDELLEIWEIMKAKSFLNYNLDIKKQDENINEFKKLKLSEQKQHLCEILDKNQLYVNLSSLEDKGFLCTDVEKQITKDFYRMEE